MHRTGGIPTGTAGTITEPAQADMVFLAHEMLRDPYWPRHAAKVLRAELPPQPQYARAW